MSGNRLTEAVWALFRVVIGLLFALHGASTVFGAFGGNRGSGLGFPGHRRGRSGPWSLDARRRPRTQSPAYETVDA